MGGVPFTGLLSFSCHLKCGGGTSCHCAPGNSQTSWLSCDGSSLARADLRLCTHTAKQPLLLECLLPSPRELHATHSPAQPTKSWSGLKSNGRPDRKCSGSQRSWTSRGSRSQEATSWTGNILQDIGCRLLIPQIRDSSSISDFAS